MKLFVTDYASYNNGTQFEFGKWVDLTDFVNATDFLAHIVSCHREEVMYTDFEGFPEEFYSESMDENDLQKIFDFIEFFPDGIDNFSPDELIDLHNDYVCEVGGEQIHPFDDDFFNTFFGDNVLGAAHAAHFGDLNWGDEYITFDGRGNLKSLANFDVKNYVDIDAIVKHKVG